MSIDLLYYFVALIYYYKIQLYTDGCNACMHPYIPSIKQ